VIQLPDPFTLPWPPRRIVVHWTAGGPTASQNDRKHYHYLVQQDGQVVEGFPTLKANCRSLGGVPSWSHDDPDGYAAHCRRFNSWSMGVSLCGMLGAVEGGDPGPHPLVAQQSEVLIAFLARACIRYGLYPTEHRLMTHEEVGRLHGVQQPGKWDVRFLPIATSRGESSTVIEGDAVGPYIRAQVIQRI
jgi:hypothetical protein